MKHRIATFGRVNRNFEYLDAEDLVELARRLLGDPPPIRDLGLLGAAAARPQASAFGEDAYPDVWSKGAALLHSIVNNHPLVDGNKRLGWLATAVLLEINGASVSAATNDAVYDLVMSVAVSTKSIDEIAATLRQMHEHATDEPMSLEEARAMQGTGWEGDLDQMRTTRYP